MNDQHLNTPAQPRLGEEKRNPDKIFDTSKARPPLLPQRPGQGGGSAARFLDSPTLLLGLHPCGGSTQPLCHPHEGQPVPRVPRGRWPRCRRNGGSAAGPPSAERREAFLFTCVGSAQITHRGLGLQAGTGRNSLQMKGCQKIVFSQLRVCVLERGGGRKGPRRPLL